MSLEADWYALSERFNREFDRRAVVRSSVRHQCKLLGLHGALRVGPKVLFRYDLLSRRDREVGGLFLQNCWALIVCLRQLHLICAR